MTTDEVLTTLRETRDTLAKPDAPRRVDLRHYITPGSEAWMAFVNAHGGIPGRRVKQKTMLDWLDSVIAAVSGVAPEAVDESHLTEVMPPAEAVEPPAPPEEAPPEASDEPLAPPAEAQPEVPSTAAIEPPVPPAAAPPMERMKPPMRATPPPPVAPRITLPGRVTVTPRQTDGEPLRALTAEGIEWAREHLEGLREHPEGDPTLPRDLLHSDRYSRVFPGTVLVEPRVFTTRREAGAYLAEVLAPVQHLIADDDGVWSWLGMYYFAESFALRTKRTRPPASEVFVYRRDDGSRSYQRRYKHYLRSSWLLYRQHGEEADFFLDEDITTFGDLVDRAFSNSRVFTSRGFMPLLIHLFTAEGKLKTDTRDSIRHLMRILPQLELTYDVYGMEPDALIEILPRPIQEWDEPAVAEA